MNNIGKAILGLAAAVALGGAQAATVYSNDFSGLGPQTSPGSLSASFSAAAGAGNVSLQLNGFASLDGDNFYVDVFHLSVNGTEVFSGTFDMGGGGTNRILFNPNGGTAAPVTFGYFAGGKTDISVPVTLASGSNTVVFSYDSPVSFEGSGRAGPQGLGDEGWGLGQVTITGAVPEPESYALMLAGLAGVGFIARRRRSV